MVSLKTLKDLEFQGLKVIRALGGIEKEVIREVAETHDLRAEAIKWIKEFEKEIKKHSHKEVINPLELLKNCIGCRNKYVQIQWIKHFFNISDEELNERR